MNILTRYILTSYLKNYLISLFVLIGLYVVLDMVFNFDEFAVTRDAGSSLGTIGNIASYYFFQSFRIFAQLAGVIPVAAAAFTFLRLARFNELTAMMAAGVHLVRVAAPAILCAVVVSIVLPLLNQELVIPNIIPELTRDRNDQAETRDKAQAVQSMQDAQGRLLFAADYDPPTPTTPAVLTEVNVLGIDQSYTSADFITASRATFDSKQQAWILDNGTLTTNIGQGRRSRDVRPLRVFQTSITPEEIALYRSGDFVELLSTSRINALLDPNRQRLYGANDLLRVKHARLAQLLLNIIMVLLAISAVMIREPGQLRFAVMKCIILVGLCMATIFICQSIANHPPANPAWADRWPALMAWMPIFVFGPLSVFLLDRVKT